MLRHRASFDLTLSLSRLTFVTELHLRSVSTLEVTRTRARARAVPLGRQRKSLEDVHVTGLSMPSGLEMCPGI